MSGRKKDNIISGTKTGGSLAATTNKTRHGEDYYVRLGALGGKAKVPKGFSHMSPEKRAEAGRRGGTVSKRGKVQ